MSTPEIIFRDTQGAITWKIERQPIGCTDPRVIRFRKVSRTRTLLDQTARWTPLGWDPTRWTPKPPTVPLKIIDRVVNHMLVIDPAVLQLTLEVKA